ncbi:MAG: LacI family DNA-binding transcriptional regulator [Lachnospiraceae bacterium]|nr:LacI family DNA-binding transcriptional regulator [Lachnospiraceae bacterium]
MASIKEVAKHARVAISTVSKVLNNYPNVSEETRARVNASIQELGYVPNAVAAALSSKKAGRIAIVLRLSKIAQAIDEVNMQYLHGTINKARELNMDVVTVFYSMLEGKTTEEIINYFRSQSVNGIIFCGIGKIEKPFVKLVESQMFKVVSIDAKFINESTSCVWINQAKAQYEVAQKTMDMDTIRYKKLLYIAGVKNSFVTEERLKGIRQFAADNKLKLTIKEGDFSEKKAREITMQYGEKTDMIACASDMMAIGAMRALTDMDIFRPVCGFDGITLMGYVGKQMNTVKQDFFQIAEESVGELRRLLDGGEGQEVILEHSLVRMEYLDIIR